MSHDYHGMQEQKALVYIPDISEGKERVPVSVRAVRGGRRGCE